MKNHIVPLFIPLTILISGCEDPVVNNKIAKPPEKVFIESKKVIKQTINPPVLVKQTKKIVKKKKPKPKPKIIEKEEASTEQPELDLSVPAKFKGATTSNHSSTAKIPKYLPDLFANKEIQKDDAVQIKGKMISKLEEEADKQRAVDGIGIGIRLTP